MNIRKRIMAIDCPFGEDVPSVAGDSYKQGFAEGLEYAADLAEAREREMLEALTYLYHNARNNGAYLDHAIDEALKAIAKATGGDQ